MNQARLILMCAPSGAGKTTAAKALEMSLGAIRLSSDELRAVIGKGESDQSVSHIVFRTMETMAEYFLRNNRSVIIDATNYHLKARKSFIAIARKVFAPVDAYVLDRPLEQLLEWNKQRCRQVPDDIIKKQFDNFVKPVKGEVDEVYYL